MAEARSREGSNGVGVEIKKDFKKNTKRILASLNDAWGAQSEAQIVTYFIPTALNKLAIAPAQAHPPHTLIVVKKAVFQGLKA